MEPSRSKGIDVFSRLHPVFIALLLPEIINAFIWIVMFLGAFVLKSSFGRFMETHVGVGIVYSVASYAFMFFGAIGVLVFFILFVVDAVKTAQGLKKRSERARGHMVFSSVFCLVFLLVVLGICNYAWLYSYAGSFVSRSGLVYWSPYEENTIRTMVRYVDVVLLPYFVWALVFFTRPRTKEMFR